MKRDSLFLERRGAALICLLLATWTIAVFWRLLSSEFVNLDDNFIIYRNPMVASGWTMQGFIWSLTTSYYEYWHPLTWWSHMTDCQMFGMSAHWHHLTSLGWHVLNTWMLFAAFRELTGMMLRSAVVAALFALHPMHVESVAWLSERKDVLGMFFGAASLWAYGRYVKRSEAKSADAEFFFRVSLVAFLCGIMSKPMVVTLPFVLLLFDYWPLNRFATANDSKREGERSQSPGLASSRFFILLREKSPYFVFSLFSSVITYMNVKAAHNIVSAGTVPWSLRLANVPVSYARYLSKLVWPTRMSVMYPLPDHWALWQVAVSVIGLFIISAVALLYARRAPYLVVGWLVFLGTIVPTISLVPVGFQSIADRYTYLPYIGLFVAIVWAMADICSRWKFRIAVLGSLTTLALLACSIVAWIQVGYWQSDFTLWPHCLAVTTRNFTAEYNYGYALQSAGHAQDAIPHLRAALSIRPSHIDANLNLGRALAATGNFKEATNYFAKSVELEPGSSDARGNLGAVLYELRDYAGAETACAESVRLNPSDFRSLVYLARAQGQENKFDDAVRNYSEALRILPTSAQAHYYLGLEYLKRGMVDEAISSLGEAVRLNPSYAEARAELDRALERGSAPPKSSNPGN